MKDKIKNEMWLKQT